MIARRLRWTFLALAVAAGVALYTANGFAQRGASPPQDAAPLVVEGIVRQIYTDENQRDQLVEIEVQRSEARRSASSATARYPAPAELLYVHLARPNGAADSATRSNRLPRTGELIRAYLKSRAAGGWQ
jgi:hypothetical protein